MDSFTKRQLSKVFLSILFVVFLSCVFGSWHGVFADDTITISLPGWESRTVQIGKTITLPVVTNDPAGFICKTSPNPGGGQVEGEMGDDPDCSYTAPSVPGTYSVYAVSYTNRSIISNEIEIYVQAYSVSILGPTTRRVQAGTSITLSVVTDDPAGFFCETPLNSGDIERDDSTCVYTAPSQPGTYYMDAASYTDPSISSGEIKLIVLPDSVGTITISPLNSTTTSGGTITFTATVTGTNNHAVTWFQLPNREVVCPVDVVIDCGEGLTGLFDQLTGTFTVPIANGTYYISAVSADDPSGENIYADPYNGGVATVVVQDGPTVRVGPPEVYSGSGGGVAYYTDPLHLSVDSTTVQVGDSFEFDLKVNGRVSPIKWILTEGPAAGTISNKGVYTAPMIPGTYHLVVSDSDATTTATINVVQGDKPPVEISVFPTSVVLSFDSTSSTTPTQQFTAQVLNASSSTAVTWSVLEPGGGNITSIGLYTIPALGTSTATSTYHVLVTSVADPSKIASSTVYVVPTFAATTPTTTPAIPSPKKVPAKPEVDNTVGVVNTHATTTLTFVPATTTSTSTAVGIVPIIPSSLVTQVIKNTQQSLFLFGKFATGAASSTVSAIQTPTGSTVANSVSTIGAFAGFSTWTVSSLLASPMFASPITASEIFFVPLRLWGLVLSVLGLRRRNRPWGTVYDSVTKLPIDPAVVTLYDEKGKKISTSITDLDGRFGFFVPKGIYHLKVDKSNYAFPSTKLADKESDEIYSNLYFGEKIEVLEDGPVIYKNIPMDPKAFDWNEFAKHKMGVMQFHSLSERLSTKIGDIIFWLGYAVGLVSVFVIPHVYSITILSVYVILLVLRFSGVHGKVFGTITDRTNHPLSFASVSIFSKTLNRELFKKVADQYGRYYALVPKGEYEIKVSRKNPDESYTKIYQKEVNAKKGVINEKIRV